MLKYKKFGLNRWEYLMDEDKKNRSKIVDNIINIIN